MTRTVFANNRNFSHKGSSDKSLSSTPDVCKTPIGSATPPIPYPVMSKAADAAGYTSSVFIDGNPTAISSSTHKSCTGDEPGRAKGLISSTTSDKTSFLSYSFDVKCEGEGVVRHQDLTMMNNANTMGAVFGMVTAPTIIEDESFLGGHEGLCELMIRLDLTVDYCSSSLEGYRLYSVCGEYDVTLLLKDSFLPGDAYVDLIFSDVDTTLSYCLECSDASTGVTRHYFRSRSYASLSAPSDSAHRMIKGK